MAIVDLAKYDLLDLIISSTLSDEKKGQYLYDFMNSLMVFISDIMADKLSDEDETALQKLLNDPKVDPIAIEKFYKQRIPNYDSLVFGSTVMFKRDFLLKYYRGMLEETVKSKDASMPQWIKIVASAEEDKWELVARIIKQIEDTYAQPPAIV